MLLINIMITMTTNDGLDDTGEVPDRPRDLHCHHGRYQPSLKCSQDYNPECFDIEISF
jgi:hypothetical protein